jgi:hypothetical protein
MHAPHLFKLRDVSPARAVAATAQTLPPTLPMRPPPWSRLVRLSPPQPTPLAASLLSHGAACTTHWPNRAAASPERTLQRLAPPVAAEPPSRLRFRPVRAWKSSPRDPQAIPRPRPAGHGRRFARIWPDRRRPVPGDPIASPNFFPRVNLQSKGFSVRNKKLLGAYVKCDS